MSIIKYYSLTHSGCDYIPDLYRMKPTKIQGRIDKGGTHEVLALTEKLVAVDACRGREAAYSGMQPLQGHQCSIRGPHT